MNKLALLFLLCLPVLAQPVSFGIKAGVPLTDAFDIATGDRPFRSVEQRYTIGPMIQLNLPLGFGIEANALYKRIGYDATFPTYNARARTNSWEFPILFKYGSSSGILRPYGGIGPNFNSIGEISEFASNITGGGSVGSRVGNTFVDLFRIGLVVSSGIQIRTPVIRVSPEIRFTRWGEESLDPLALLGLRQNQVEFLVGLHF
jgi:hypothetical protein